MCCPSLCFKKYLIRTAVETSRHIVQMRYFRLLLLSYVCDSTITTQSPYWFSKVLTRAREVGINGEYVWVACTLPMINMMFTFRYICAILTCPSDNNNARLFHAYFLGLDRHHNADCVIKATLSLPQLWDFYDPFGSHLRRERSCCRWSIPRVSIRTLWDWAV